MSGHSCGPETASMKKARALAKGLGTEMAEKSKIKMKRDLEERLGLYPWHLQNTRIWRERRFWMTQEALAEMAGVSAATIRKHELEQKQGKRRPLERLTAAAKIQRAMNAYAVREDPIVRCCSGLRGMIDRGWIKVRKGTDGLDPDRLYFLIELRGTTTNLILSRCLICGEDIYPAPDTTKEPK